ncbi:hypothetical protein ACFOLF_35010 [Paenibacillus sepulcri]|uniref:Uncharacterized protein n=1 Tax=Paenibacillus sepulcri TaxID=359917 RepID=A0ABS7C3I0_9BACL|nr:hypothetical protein [Paenibacillus sepulcri]
MSLMIFLFILFLAVGMWRMWSNQSGKKDKALFVSITTLGAALWGSIIVRHPFDLNKLIAWMFYWQ